MDYNGLRKATNDAINSLARFQQELDRMEAADVAATETADMVTPSGANENVVNPALGTIPASVVSKGAADDYEATSGRKANK